MGRDEKTDVNGTPSWESMKVGLREALIYVADGAPREIVAATKQSQASRTLEIFLDGAARQAELANFLPGSDEANRLFERARWLWCNLFYSFDRGCGHGYPSGTMLTFAKVRDFYSMGSSIDRDQLFNEAKKGRRLELDLRSFTAAMEPYLLSDFRNFAVDRMILCALIDKEITDYLESIMFPSEDARTSKVTRFGRGAHPLIQWIDNVIIGLLVSALALIVSWYGAFHGWLSDEIAIFVAVGVPGLVAVGAAMRLWASMTTLTHWRRERMFLIELPGAMRSFYGELHEPGPMSLPRVRRRAEELCNLGARWPAAVWALLDDLNARGVVLLPSL